MTSNSSARDSVTSTRANNLARTSQCSQAVREAVCDEAAISLESLKKDVLVAQTQRQLEGKRWLPSVLRAKG